MAQMILVLFTVLLFMLATSVELSSFIGEPGDGPATKRYKLADVCQLVRRITRDDSGASVPDLRRKLQAAHGKAWFGLEELPAVLGRCGIDVNQDWFGTTFLRGSAASSSASSGVHALQDACETPAQQPPHQLVSRLSAYDMYSAVELQQLVVERDIALEAAEKDRRRRIHGRPAHHARRLSPAPCF